MAALSDANIEWETILFYLANNMSGHSYLIKTSISIFKVLLDMKLIHEQFGLGSSEITKSDLIQASLEDLQNE